MEIDDGQKKKEMYHNPSTIFANKNIQQPATPLNNPTSGVTIETAEKCAS